MRITRRDSGIMWEGLEEPHCTPEEQHGAPRGFCRAAEYKENAT